MVFFTFEQKSLQRWGKETAILKEAWWGTGMGRKGEQRKKKRTLSLQVGVTQPHSSVLKHRPGYKAYTYFITIKSLQEKDD